ncbi:hypothetical protein ACHWWK_27365 [Klebsiella pneumoniae]
MPTRQPGGKRKMQGDTGGRSADKREAGLDGFRAKPERENDGKNGEHHKNRPGEDGGVSAPYLQQPG